jgi:hypothetical protein
VRRGEAAALRVSGSCGVGRVVVSFAGVLCALALVACGEGGPVAHTSGSAPRGVAASVSGGATGTAGPVPRPVARALQPAPGAPRAALPTGVVATVAGGSPLTVAAVNRLYARFVRASRAPAPDPPRYTRCVRAARARLPAAAAGSAPAAVALRRSCEQRHAALIMAATTELLIKAQRALPPRTGESRAATFARARRGTLCRAGYVVALCANAFAPGPKQAR